MSSDGDIYTNDFTYFTNAIDTANATTSLTSSGELEISLAAVSASPVYIADNLVLTSGAKYTVSFDFKFIKSNDYNPANVLVTLKSDTLGTSKTSQIGTNTVVVKDDTYYSFEMTWKLDSADDYKLLLGMQDGTGWAGAKVVIDNLKVENVSGTIEETIVGSDTLTVLGTEGISVNSSNAKTTTAIETVEIESANYTALRVAHNLETSTTSTALAFQITGLDITAGTYTLAFNFMNTGTVSTPGAGYISFTSVQSSANNVQQTVTLGAYSGLNTWYSCSYTLTVTSTTTTDYRIAFTSAGFLATDVEFLIANMTLVKTA